VRLGADCIATAHHADDAVESAWLQAARGAGPIGRAGPEPEMQWWGFTIVRPLLELSRSAIEAYADRCGLRWREDPTNVDPRYARNRLRHQVLPEALDLAQARAAMAGLRDEAAKLRQAVDALRTAGTGSLNFRRFARGHLAQAEADILARLLIDVAVELHGALAADLVESLVAAIDDPKTETRRFTGSRVVVEVSGGWVTFEASRGQGTRLLDGRRTVEVTVEPGDELPWFRRTVRIVDTSIAPSVDRSTGQLRLRGPRPGERIDTDAGSRLIFDVLADHEVPPSDRWWWPCLYRAGRCVEVVDVTRAVES
jgi:hypothetical protein